MARKALKQYVDEVKRFIGVFESYGSATGPSPTPFATALFCNLVMDGEVFLDHVWLYDVECIIPLAPNPGDLVSFDARVRKYTKRMKGKVKEDYGLCALRNPAIEKRTKNVPAYDPTLKLPHRYRAAIRSGLHR